MTDLRALRGLEPVFYRAPSAHNTQPWLLAYEPDRLELGFDPARHLEAGDPTRRDLFLSLGAFVEAVLIAAAAEGIALAFSAAVDVEGAQVGSFAETGTVYETRFAPKDLERRRTSRLAYAPGRLADGELAAARSELEPGAQLHELPAPALLELFTAADRHLYDSTLVVEELRSWLRLSRRDPNYERDGLSAECLALSPLEARAVSVLLRPAVYRVVRRVRLQRAFTASARAVLEVDGSVLVLEAPADTPEQLLAHGRSLLRIWLALSGAGLYTHPLSQLVDCAATERELAARLGVTPERRLLSVFRAGRSDPPARSHRLR